MNPCSGFGHHFMYSTNTQESPTHTARTSGLVYTGKRETTYEN